MIEMKYRTKLYLALVGIAVMSTAFGIGITYYKVRGFLLFELRSQVMSIASVTASILDGDQLKMLTTRKDQLSPYYQKVQKILRNIRNQNRRDDIFVKFIYTIMPIKKNSAEFVFQVDAEEDTPDFSHIGDFVPDAIDSDVAHHLDEIYSPDHFVNNQWGVWMTGFAPVFDSKGNYVATVGVDLRAGDVLKKLDTLIHDGILAFLTALTLALLSAYFLSRQTTRSLKTLCEGVHEIGLGRLNKQITLGAHDEFDTLAKEINSMMVGLQERERLRLNFARYVSQHVLESIMTTEGGVKLAGERRKVTMLFSDIRQFTQLSEKLAPEEVVSLLNEYFGIMVEIIFRNHGTLDKFIGDGIMIEFGAPLDDPLQESHAIETALEMQRELKVLCRKWQLEGKPNIKMGIGIHTGIAVVGNIGSERRIEYTAIGDTVNVAARLEQLTKEVDMPILVSDTTVMAIKNKFKFQKLGPMLLRGRTDPIIVYALKDKDK